MELFTPFGVPLEELTFFGSRLWMVATSCAERRLVEYENVAWRDFIEATKKPRRAAR